MNKQFARFCFVSWLATLLTLCTVCTPAVAAESAGDPVLVEGATIHRDRIAFGSGGKIWLVSADGGIAKPLTDSTSYDSLPRFSPDGARLAFMRRSQSMHDVYLCNAQTGEESRLTFHPGFDFPVGWTPDSRGVLIHSTREGVGRLFTMRAGDPLPSPLPLPSGYAGSLSSDGKQLAYLPRSLEYQSVEWPYYRGGKCSPLWIVELDSGAVTQVTEGKDNVRDPMWVGDRVYFLWDRDGRFNLYAYHVETMDLRKLTQLENFGLRSAATDGTSIILVGHGGLQRFDLETESSNPVRVEIPRDESALRTRVINAFGQVHSYSLGRDGARAVVCARGDVFLLDTISGKASNVTKTSGIAEREASLSPDEKELAYFSDVSGEYALHVRNVDSSEVSAIPIEAQPSFYDELTWSPRRDFIAFTDKRLTVWFADVAAGTVTAIDQSTSSSQRLFSLDWSPDGRYLAYVKTQENRLPRIHVHDTQTGENQGVTPDDVFAVSPVFDKSGRYLYFISSPNAPSADFGWAVLAGILSEPLVVGHLNAIVLRAGDPAPVLRSAPNLSVDWKVSDALTVDFTGIESRIVPIDIAQHSPVELTAGPAGVVYLIVNEWPATPGAALQPSQTLYRLDLRAPADLRKVIPLVQAYAVSRDGTAILCNDAANLRLAQQRQDSDADQSLAAANWRLTSFDGAKFATRPVPITALPVPVDPALEWKQIVHEAWKLMREYFYDPHHHGLNWEHVGKDYADFLPNIRSREQLNILMRRMVGSVSVSHLGVAGGDVQASLDGNESVGLLGADLEVADGLYRFKRVFRSGHFDAADPRVQAPLAQPGAEVADGEYLFAIDDVVLDATRNIHSAMRGKSSLPVRLLVGPTPDRWKAREIRVVPLANETTLRMANWVEANRNAVTELSQGKLGYFHVPDYGAAGVQTFLRGYFGNRTKPGMIIDQRFNGGGITPDFFAELLARRPLYHYVFHDGDELPVPVNGRADAATVLIINEDNGSAAETFAMMFQLGELGPIVGTTTSGAVIGPYASRSIPRLVDGGSLRIPARAAYTPAGHWVENDGIHPEIPVEIMPQDWRAGRDPQLEAAVHAGLEGLSDGPGTGSHRPDFPVHP